MPATGKKKRPQIGEAGTDKLIANFPKDTAQKIRTASDSRGVTISSVLVEMVEDRFKTMGEDNSVVIIPNNLSETTQVAIDALRDAMERLIASDQTQHHEM